VGQEDPGVRCEVAAPSKLQKPCSDRVKTDAKDAVHLARLLRLDEITAVAVPTVAQESARDLVRAREDARGDLMRARHRLSKLLLRHGIVYYDDGHAWTRRHDAWLRRQRFENTTTRLTFESDYDTVLTVTARRDRLDAAIAVMAADSEFTPVVHRLGCLRGISTLTAFGLAVEIGRLGPVHRQHHRLLRRTGALRALLRRLKIPGPRSPRPATPTPAGSWSRPPGTTAPATGPARPCATGGNWPRRPPVPVATPATGGSMPAGPGSPTGRRRTRSPTPPSPASSPAGADPWPAWRNNHTPQTLRRPRR
jgi:hypothetical protein